MPHVTCLKPTRWVSENGRKKTPRSSRKRVRIVLGDDERSKNRVEVENAATLKNEVR